MIVLKDTNEIIGTCLLYYNEEEEHWDISYNLGNLFWGNGYVIEAMNMIMRYAVERMNIKEIATSYAIENLVSGRVLQKLGFQFVEEVDYECNSGELVTKGNYCCFKVK